MSHYQIEKNVPYPGRKLPPIPFHKMEVNDSVEIELKKESDHRAITQRIYRENKKGEMRFSCFKIDDSKVRVFRTK